MKVLPTLLSSIPIALILLLVSNYPYLIHAEISPIPSRPTPTQTAAFRFRPRSTASPLPIHTHIDALRPHLHTTTILHLRGGGTSDSSRSFLNYGTNKQQPSSFQQSSSQSQFQSYRPNNHNHHNVQVTDVTDEMKEQEREETKEVIDAFLTRESRNSFIVRVYSILTVQLILVALSVLAFGRYPSLSYWMMTRGKIVPWLCLFTSTATMLTMTISEKARQSSPLKFQLLGLFSIAEAIVVGMISSLYKSKTVMSAALSTALATLVVTAYTVLNRDSKRDLSQWGAGLSSVGTIFVFYGFIHLLSSAGILPPNFLPYDESLFCVIGASLFSMYLAYHTRLIVSGKHTKFQLSEKDYVFGALLLYNDIINMFLYMLRLMAAEDRK